MSIVEKVSGWATDDPQRVRERLLGEATAVNAVYLFIIAVLAVLLLYPLVLLLQASFTGVGPFEESSGYSIANYVETYLNPATYRLWFNTLVIAGGAAIVSTTLGVSMAWAVARTNTPFRKFIGLTMLIPYPAPAYLIAVSYIFLLDPKIGLLNTALLDPVFGATLSIYGLPGIIFVLGLSSSTLPFLISIASFRNMDPALEDAARMGGAGIRKIARTITVPLVLPSISAAGLLVFAKTLDAFGVPIFLGLPHDPPVHVFATRIWSATSLVVPPDYGLATALSTTLLLVAIGGLWLQKKAIGQREKYETVTGQGYSPRRLDLGRWRWAVFGIAVSILFFAVVLPFVVLFISSTTSTWFGRVYFLSDQARFTLEHYATLFQRGDFILSSKNSLIIGFVGATLGMLFISVASYMVVKVDERRSKLVARTSGVLDQFLFLPAAIPGVVMALGLLWVVLSVPTLGLYGTIWIIMIGYVARELPVGSRTIYGSFTQLSDELEEQSYVAGASWLRTIKEIVLPLSFRGYVAGWILLFIAMLKKLSIPIFLYESESIVYPVLIFQLKVIGEYEQLAGAGVLLFAIVIVVVVVAGLLGIDLID